MLKKVKALVVLIILCSTTQVLFSQNWELGCQKKIEFDKKNWAVFKNSKLYVVLENDGNSDLDKLVVEVVKSCWSFNEVEFVKKSNKNSLSDAPNMFFLNITKEKIYIRGNVMLCLKIIGKTNGKDFKEYAFQYFDYKEGEVRFPLVLFLRNIQWYSNMALNGNIKARYLFKNLSRIKYEISEEPISPYKSKPLYILSNCLNRQIKNINDIKKWYHGEVYVVTEQELGKVLEKNEDVNVFLFLSGVMFAPSTFYPDKLYNDKSLKSYDGLSVAYIYNYKSGQLLYRKKKELNNTTSLPGVSMHHLKNIEKDKMILARGQW